MDDYFLSIEQNQYYAFVFFYRRLLYFQCKIDYFLNFLKYIHNHA